jgi:hypothetical protein
MRAAIRRRTLAAYSWGLATSCGAVRYGAVGCGAVRYSAVRCDAGGLGGAAAATAAGAGLQKQLCKKRHTQGLQHRALAEPAAALAQRRSGAWHQGGGGVGTWGQWKGLTSALGR